MSHYLVYGSRKGANTLRDIRAWAGHTKRLDPLAGLDDLDEARARVLDELLKEDEAEAVGPLVCVVCQRRYTPLPRVKEGHCSSRCTERTARARYRDQHQAAINEQHRTNYQGSGGSYYQRQQARWRERASEEPDFIEARRQQVRDARARYETKRKVNGRPRSHHKSKEVDL